MYSSLVSFQDHYNKYLKFDQFDHPKSNSADVTMISKELMAMIFSYLNPKDLAACSEVSNEFYASANDIIIWKSLYRRFVPITVDVDGKAYKAATIIIFSNFKSLQKELNEIETIRFRVKYEMKNPIPGTMEALDRSEVNAHIKMSYSVLKDAIENRLFFLAEAQLQLLDSEEMLILRDLESKVCDALKNVLLESKSLEDRDAIKNFYEKFMDFVISKKNPGNRSTFRFIFETLFVEAVKKQNRQVAEFIREVQGVRQDALEEAWEIAKSMKSKEMKGYLKPLLEKKGCVIS